MPEQLARFVVDEWPGAYPHESLRAWYVACIDWLAADSARHPRSNEDERSPRLWLPGASRRTLPLGEYGGAIDVLREKMRIRRAMGPCPREACDAAAW